MIKKIVNKIAYCEICGRIELNQVNFKNKTCKICGDKVYIIYGKKAEIIEQEIKQLEQDLLMYEVEYNYLEQQLNEKNKKNRIDIKKVALFLAGKLPPYYGNSNLYKFSKALKKLAPKEFSNDKITFIQKLAKNNDEEFYFMALDDLWDSVVDKKEKSIISKQDIIEMLQEIGVPNEILFI